MANTGKRRLGSGLAGRVPAAVTPLRSQMKHLSDEQLLSKLSSFGIELDRAALGRLCAQNLDAGHLAQRLVDPATVNGRSGKAPMHQVEDCVAQLWQRWFPDQPSFDRLEDRILAGYDLIETREVASACRIWLEAWAEVLALLDRMNTTSIDELDRQFSGGEDVLDWIHALEQELWNAGLDDPQFLRARIAFCEQALTRLTAGDDFFRDNRRRALAESYFELADGQRTDALYREWLSADPQWGWGWIGWARCYGLASEQRKDLHRAEQLLLEGLAVPLLRDVAELKQYLATLYEDQGRVQEATEMRPRVASSHPVARSGPKVGRNDPCPCGSGKKFKKCCGSASSDA